MRTIHAALRSPSLALKTHLPYLLVGIHFHIGDKHASSYFSAVFLFGFFFPIVVTVRSALRGGVGRGRGELWKKKNTSKQQRDHKKIVGSKVADGHYYLKIDYWFGVCTGGLYMHQARKKRKKGKTPVVYLKYLDCVFEGFFVSFIVNVARRKQKTA